MSTLRFKIAPVWKGKYSSSTTYAYCDEVQDPAGSGVYRSLVDGNTGNALSDTSYWTCVCDLTEMQEAVEDTETFLSSAQEAEAGRVTAETARVNAESNRVTAEAARVNAEEDREDAEEARVSAENTRVSSENTRIADETVRISNENTRISNETARVSAETARVTAEAARVTAEEARVTAESGRVTDYQENIVDDYNDNIKSVVTELDTTVTGLQDGTVQAGSAVLADNLTSWDELGELPVEDEWTDVVRTTAGDLSVISDEGAKIVSITPTEPFYASALKFTGFNLLRNAVAVGTGYYFLVPALEFGTFGTAEKPNGILFTDSDGNNLTPTVYFKSYEDGVPTSITDGTSCSYTDSNGYRFYTTSEIGYLVVSGITLSSTCAHVGWSRRYDEYVSVSNSNDAGGSITLSGIITAIHSYNLMLTVSRGGTTIADTVTFGSTAATWTRNVDRVQPTWTTTADEVSEGSTQTYTHTCTISAMKQDGAVECGSLSLTVSGATISYNDTSSTATTDYVIYQLATAVTGTVTISPTSSIEDWGLEVLQDASGSAYITTQYYQGYPDTLASIASAKLLAGNEATAQAIAQLQAEIDGLKAGLENLGETKAVCIDSEYLPKVCGQYLVVEGAGAPSVVPMFIGQRYHDTTNKKVYEAFTVTNSTSDWVALN